MSSVFIVLFIFLLLLSFKVALPFALGIAVCGYALVEGSLPITLVWQSFYSSLDSFPLLAIPFFMLAGDLMSFGGISKRLIGFCRTMLGSVKGSLGMVTVVACMFFAAISGSAPATAATIGSIMIPAMVDEGYDRGFSASLTACAGALGPIIPPSILFVIFGVTASVSVSSLFLAGILPGVLIGFILMIYVAIVARKKGYGGAQEKVAAKEKLHSFKDAIWALLLPVIILGSIYSGFATPTEAAVISCVYALFVGKFIYRELKIKDLPHIFYTTLCTTGYCLLSLAAASAFSKLLVMKSVPTLIATGIMSMTDNYVVIILLINLVLLISGCFIEPVPAITIFAPLFLPLATSIGMNPIHFGCMMVLNLTIGMCTPPVGSNLFVASGVGNIPVSGMFKSLVPCLICMIIALILVAFIPQLSLLFL